MSSVENKDGADSQSAPSENVIKEGTPQSYHLGGISQNENLPTPNAYLIQNSRSMKRADYRLFLSPHYNHYLVLKSEVDLIAQLEPTYALIEVFDQLADESPEIRELSTQQIWAEDELQKKGEKLLQISISYGVPVEKLEVSSDDETRNLYARCDELREKINVIKAQMEYIQNYSRGDKLWSDPLPFPDELLPVQTFDTLFLPEPLRRYAEDLSETMQCPIDYIAVGLLTTFSSIIGAGCVIRPLKEGDWSVVPNLWGAIVGSPGIKKTPALNASMVPLAALEKKADEDFAKEKKEAEVHKIERDARRKNLKAKIEKATLDEAQEDLENAKISLLSLESEVSSPCCKRFKTNDTTIEKLTELLAENSRGLLVFRDELIGFLVTLEQEGRENSRAFYIEAWTGWSSSGVKTDRIARGTTSCNPCVSILGGIQPSKLQLYLQQTLANIGNDGFIQRFQLLVYPDRPKGWKLVDRKPDGEARDQVINIGKFLANTDFISIGARIEDNFPLPVFHFDQEAQEFFYNYYRNLEERLIRESDEGMITEHLAKYRSLMPSLALLSYLIRTASGASPGSGIALEDAKRAADSCSYLETHARRIYAMIDSKSVHAAKALLKKVREGIINDGFTQREVYRKCWSGLDSRGTVDDACTELVAKGWLKKEIIPPTSKGGPPSYKYRLHPCLRKSPRKGADETDE